MATPTAPPALVQGVLPAIKPVFVVFSAEIIAATSESLIGLMSNLANQGQQEVHLLLTTPGGSVMHGLTIYNVLRGLPFTLVTHNAGSVNSIGNAIFLAGAKRYACPHSTFMFHGVGFDANAGQRFEEKLLRERLNGILADQKRIGDIITERTKITEEQVGGLFSEAQTKDAAYAVGVGIVDEVRNIEIPKGCTVHSLVFKR
jgi:ATP-dependent protease ClpP protease subunit